MLPMKVTSLRFIPLEECPPWEVLLSSKVLYGIQRQKSGTGSRGPQHDKSHGLKSPNSTSYSESFPDLTVHSMRKIAANVRVIYKADHRSCDRTKTTYNLTKNCQPDHLDRTNFSHIYLYTSILECMLAKILII